MIDPQQLLEAFAHIHVIKGFRERFVHEAIHKPERLHSRIRHTIGDVFSESCRDGANPFAPDDVCILFTGDGPDFPKEYRWSDLEHSPLRGFGLLAVSTDGTRFYAETERGYQSPPVSYSSGNKRI